MKATTVVSVRGCKPAELLVNPEFVYVGRAVGRVGWQKSIFANPYPASKFYDGPSGAVAWFFEDLADAIQGREISKGRTLKGEHVWFNGVFHQMARRLPDLRGKVLGCWCGSWEPGQPDIGCHAVVLARLADAS